jgi:hypothetical protein
MQIRVLKKRGAHLATSVHRTRDTAGAMNETARRRSSLRTLSATSSMRANSHLISTRTVARSDRFSQPNIAVCPTIAARRIKVAGPLPKTGNGEEY